MSKERYGLDEYGENDETVASTRSGRAKVNGKKVESGASAGEKRDQRRGYQAGTHLKFFLVEIPNVMR